MFITLSSDYIYVIAMLKTTPLVVTIGLSLTMPLAVLGDLGMQHPVKGQVVLGAALVLVSFVVIGLEDSKTPPGADIGVQDEISDVTIE
jgi:solute carrier family 35 protein F5